MKRPTTTLRALRDNRTENRPENRIESAMKNDFKGNKSSLPSKPCAVCQRPMTWRKAWAKNWDSVRYCSDACRAKKNTAPSTGSAS